MGDMFQWTKDLLQKPDWSIPQTSASCCAHAEIKLKRWCLYLDGEQVVATSRWAEGQMHGQC